jgi:hypothetical protein
MTFSFVNAPVVVEIIDGSVTFADRHRQTALHWNR